MIRKNQPRPLYREILRDAFLTAWQERKLWIFALFAGMLQTGGMYDVLIRSGRIVSEKGNLVLTPRIFAFWPLDNPIATVGFFERFLFASILVLAILALSVIAQGALAYGLGTRTRGKTPPLRQCLHIGAHHLFPVAFLNLFTLGLIGVGRFIVIALLAMTVTETSYLNALVFLLTFGAFLVVTFILTTVHMFALNSIILEGASLWNGILHGYRLFKKSWFIILETGALLFVLGIALFLLAFVLFGIAGLPILLLLVSFMILPTPGLFWLTMLVGIALFFTVMLATGALSITFQYDTWHRLFRRVDSGNAHAKLHRVLDWILNLLPTRI